MTEIEARRTHVLEGEKAPPAWVVPEGMTGERLRAVAQSLASPDTYCADDDVMIGELFRWADTLDAPVRKAE